MNRIKSASVESGSIRLVGYCPICQSDTVFEASHSWHRDHLVCQTCPNGSVPRERALALVLNEICPDWRVMSIHESSPGGRGISVKLADECPEYVGTQFFPDVERGTIKDGWRCEDLETQTFADGIFDIVVSLDVMEHVYHPDKVFSEVHRTLKPGGFYICTFPIRNYQIIGWERRFILNDDGTRTDLRELEIHGNPISNEGSIVTIDYGYDIHKSIVEWAPFDVRITRFASPRHGIIGEYTEVIVCQKAGHPPQPEVKVVQKRPSLGVSLFRRLFG